MTKQQKDFIKLKRLNTWLGAFFCLHLIVFLLPCLFLILIWGIGIIPAAYITLEIVNNTKLSNLLKEKDLKDKERLIQSLQKGALVLLLMESLSLAVFLYLSIFFVFFVGGILTYLVLLWLLLLVLPFPLFIAQYILLGQIKNDLSSDTPVEDDTKTKGTAPLWETVLKNNMELVQTALAQGTKLNEPYPANGNTPLHIAAWNGYTEIAKLLLAQPGINKEAKNLAGKTPLDLAKEQGHTETAALLEK